MKSKELSSSVEDMLQEYITN